MGGLQLPQDTDLVCIYFASINFWVAVVHLIFIVFSTDGDLSFAGVA